jgi:hypothetical protein
VHEAAYWKEVIAHDYAVPAGATASALARELAGHLGDADPEWRDEIAATVLTEWIGRKTLPVDEVRAFIPGWLADMKNGAGAAPSNATLRRSYAALMLAQVVNRHNAEAFLSAGEFSTIASAALDYLAAERDVRGYDDRLGWIHSAAHTADLLRAIARSPSSSAAMQPRVLDAIGRKLRTADAVFVFGEDERFARAIAMLLIRDDFELDAFKAWLGAVTTPSSAPVSVASLRASQNVKNTLAKLGVLLARQPSLPPPAAAAKDAVLAAVKF